MKIDTANALKITATGAGLWWLAFGVPPLLDSLPDDPDPKAGVLILAMYFGCFCGTAFYAMMTVPALRALRRRFPARPWGTLALTFWCFLPLAPVLVFDGLVLNKVLTD